MKKEVLLAHFINIVILVVVRGGTHFQLLQRPATYYTIKCYF